jgi:hypothetical protein
MADKVVRGRVGAWRVRLPARLPCVRLWGAGPRNRPEAAQRAGTAAGGGTGTRVLISEAQLELELDMDSSTRTRTKAKASSSS